MHNVLFIDRQLRRPAEETVINDYDKSVNAINLLYRTPRIKRWCTYCISKKPGLTPQT